METLVYKKKLDLSKDNQNTIINGHLTVDEMEVEIECGPSMLNKSVKLTFLGSLPDEKFEWPFHLSDYIVRRVTDITFGENSWSIKKVLVDSEEYKDGIIYLSLFANKQNFIDNN